MKLLTSLFSLALALPIAAQMPQPTAEHQKLAEFAGVWDVTIDFVGEDNKPVKSKGTCVRKQPMGGFWLVDKFQAQMMGQSFSGLGTTGYDPVKKKYVGTWIDSMTPSIMVTEGGFDKTGKILTMSGMAPGFDGKPVMNRTVTTIKDRNTHLFQMFAPGPDGKELTMLTITYNRRVKAVDKVPGK
ncbi:MAG: hypothetical protein ACI8UD_003113 [Planctomycetota bacterium]|jgi:hypothetical protein